MRADDAMPAGLARDLVDQVRKDAREDHARLRAEVNGLESRLGALEAHYYDLQLTLAGLQSIVKNPAPPDLSRVTMTPRFAVWLIGGSLGIIGTVVGSTLAVKSDVGHVSDQVSAVVSHQTDRERLDDERHESLMKQIEDLKKRQELSEIEVRNLSTRKDH